MRVSAINLLILVLVCSTASRRLIFVQEIFRHGARYPVRQLQNDYTQYMTSEDVVPGELTLQGKHMHYILGKIIYDKYWKQIWGGTQYQYKYHPSQIYVKSTNLNRTIESAQSHLLGLLQKIPSIKFSPQKRNFSLPPYKKQIQNYFYQQDDLISVFGSQNTNYKTVPIHTEKQATVSSDYPYRATPYDEGDFLLKFQDYNCPNSKKWASENYNLQQYQFIINSDPVQSFLSNLSNAVGKNVTFDDAFMYIDDYLCELYEGRQHLDLYNNQEAARVADFVLLTSIIMKVSYSDIQIKSATTRLIQNIISNMRAAMQGSGPKMVLYSAHDTTILVFNAALQLFSVKCIADNFYDKIPNEDICISKYPSFASNVLLELWKQDDLSYSVSILYNGVARMIPICGNKYVCPFQQLTGWAQQFYINDPNQACGIRKHEQYLYPILIGLLFAILVMGLIMQLFFWKDTKVQQYKRQHFEELTELNQGTNILF